MERTNFFDECEILVTDEIVGEKTPYCYAKAVVKTKNGDTIYSTYIADEDDLYDDKHLDMKRIAILKAKVFLYEEILNHISCIIKDE